MKKFLSLATLLAALFLCLTPILVSGQTLPNNWTGDTDISTYQESTVVHGGSYSCKIDVNSGVQADCDFQNQTAIPVTAGETFTVKFWYQTSAYVKGRIVLDWTGATATYGDYTDAGATSWTEFTYSGTVPSGATDVKIRIRFYDQTGYSAPETQYIDDVTFESPTGTPLTVTNGDFESWQASSAPDNPTGFSATAASKNEIDLAWTQNSSSNNVMVAYSSDGTFGTPSSGTSYASGDGITGGGTVLYNGSATSYNHTSLTAGTHYYYKAWSVDGSTDYSGGVTADASTIKDEPTNQAASFTAGTPTATTIPLAWTDNDGSVAADGYLIMVNTTGTFTAPVDGTAQSDDKDLSDGSGQVNVAHGTQTYTFTGLNPGTPYYFKIWAYTNSGSAINYKTDGTIPMVNATTGAANTNFITISDARAKVGQEVTVKGIVTNGSELGPIRYLQDNTAGIAAYDITSDTSFLKNVNRGDSITITGTVKGYYQLLELDPITSVVINSTGNTLPDPIVLTPDQISEKYEGQLVQIKSAVFSDGGKTFASKSSYSFTSGGQTGIIYVNAHTDLVGQIIPSVSVTLTAICSQFDYSDPNAGYQLLPRDMNDIVRESSIYFTKPLENINFTKTSLDFSWSTNIEGTTGMYYDTARPTYNSNLWIVDGQTKDHSISISSLYPGHIIWVQAFSVSGSDTAKSAVTSFATISNSTGNIKVYFNTPVDNSYSTGVDAIYLHNTVDDTLINYINRAKYTIDMAIYNLNNDGISNISQALIDAANRGVRVRVVGDGTTANLGFNAFTGTNVHYIKRPTSISGIMHNKFVIFDAESSNPDDPIVWTGSTNFTEAQIDQDANNVIIVQDQSLAKTYQIEFEEMWGSTGDTPDASNAKFGPQKIDNTPHEFMINGQRVECYFSPTDGVNSQIVSHIKTANHDLNIATMLLTRDDVAAQIDTASMDGAGVNMLTDQESSNSTSVNTTLSAALGSHYVFYTGAGIMHNKYMIIDEGDASSDPMIWTGSHNWSDAANNKNDENTLVVHEATIANLYYQNFMQLYLTSGGVTAVRNFDENPVQGMNVFPNPVQQGNVNVSCFISQGENVGTIQLVDMTGRMVFNRTLQLTNGENKLSYNFPVSYRGTYVMRLITRKHTWSKIVLFE
ncbi:MAG: T9SS type A sorting domain-containing protein [Bacteroidales bacterium]|nr:T9SS type A sorting domain-containing protein [Bacteroidales bacterium]